MGQTKKELVLAAFDNKPTDRVPVGFWFHFLADEMHSNAFENPAFAAENLAGHRKFIDAFKPDFVKVMSDGYFAYGNPVLRNIERVTDMKSIEPLADDNRWFTDQIAFVKTLTDEYGDDVAMFYNVFCAGTTFKFMQDGNGEEKLAAFIREDKETVKRAFDIMSKDLAKLAKRIVTEAGATGIYFSLQNMAGEGMTKVVYEEVFEPGEKEVLAAVKSVSDYNILHICGYEGHRNDLTWYRDYDVKAINWAAVVEGIPLEEGKKIFGGRAVIGGFGNGFGDVLYVGDKDAIQAEAKRITEGVGRTGVIVGADCTIPRDTDLAHLEWVREALA